MNQKNEIKMVLIGASHTGKTCIANRFAYGKFSPGEEETIGASFLSTTLQIGKENYKLNIWDTGGSEKYRSMAPMYYRNAKGAIVVIDSTLKETIAEAERWVSEFRKSSDNDEAIICVAINKIDLTKNRVVTDSDIEKFCEGSSIKMKYETSALTGQNINDMFTSLANKIVETLVSHSHEQPDIYVVDVIEPNTSPKSKSGCCK